MKAARRAAAVWVFAVTASTIAGAAGAAGAAEAQKALTRELERGESIRILRPESRYPTPMKLVLGATSISFRFNSDGLLAVTDVGGPVETVIIAGDQKVRAGLSKGQVVTVWVVREMIASGDDEGLTLEVHMSSWSFALRADRAGPAGLVLRTASGVGTLFDGQRVDSVKSVTGEVKLARSGVSLPTLRRPERKVSEPEEVAAEDPVAPGPPPYPPGRLGLNVTAWMPGATIRLPYPEVEVIRPDAVSK